MAAGKLSPRQKMIGMMYLVLTALLALNVSKDILRSFVVVNDGLENSEKTFHKDVTNLYAKFDEKKTIDPQRVIENWKKAQQARKMAQELGLYISGLKKNIIRETEGFKNKEEDTIRLAFVDSKDNYDASTYIMIGESEDGSTGEARKLKDRLNKYRKDMLALLPPEDQKQINFTIDTEDPKNPEEEEERTWEMNNFYHAPLAASVTLLSKIEADVKSAEVAVVDALLKNVDADVIPFDTVSARIVAQSNYVLLGEEYKADIFLAAFNKTLKPQVFIGDYNTQAGKFNGGFDSVNVAGGIGKYSVEASSEGMKKYSGVIKMKTPKGKVMEFPFESEYIVARPALTVSAIKMNVMYPGVVNPISVSVPGIPNEKIKVSINNGTLINKGKGEYEVTGLTAGEAIISVTATMDDGTTRSMGTSKYRVKTPPKPYPFCNKGTPDNTRVVAGDVSGAPGLGCSYGSDFPFDAKGKVLSYNITVTGPTGIVLDYVSPNSNMFPDQVTRVMKNLRKGMKVYFSDIYAIGVDGKKVKLADLNIVIK